MSQSKPEIEYVVISDTNSKVLLSTPDWYAAVKFANGCRNSGGSVTIFKSTAG